MHERIIAYLISWRREFLVYFIVGVGVAFVAQFALFNTTMNRLAIRALQPIMTEVFGFYSRSSHNNITVFSLDDDDLGFYGEPWPVDLSFHARRIAQIAELKPRAIFVDILFIDPRPKASVNALGDAICTASNSGVRVVLANLEIPPSDSPLADFLSRENAKNEPCAYPASVEASNDRLDNFSWNYELQNREGARSPALELYRTMIGSASQRPPPLDQDGRDLYIIWPLSPPAESTNTLWLTNRDGEKGALTPSCRTKWTWLDAVVPPQPGHLPFCPYNLTFPMRTLQGRGPIDPGDLEAKVRGKAVLYGVNLQSAGDVVSTPWHDRLPGVQVHAMALDNLLTYGDNYKRVSEPSIEIPLSRGTEFLLVAMFILAFWYAFIVGAVAEHHEGSGENHRQTSPSDTVRRPGEHFFQYYRRAEAAIFGYLEARQVAAIQVFKSSSQTRGLVVSLITELIFLPTRILLKLSLVTLRIVVIYGAPIAVIYWLAMSVFNLSPIVSIELILFPILFHGFHLAEPVLAWWNRAVALSA